MSGDWTPYPSVFKFPTVGDSPTRGTPTPPASPNLAEQTIEFNTSEEFPISPAPPPVTEPAAYTVVTEDANVRSTDDASKVALPQTIFLVAPATSSDHQAIAQRNIRFLTRTNIEKHLEYAVQCHRAYCHDCRIDASLLEIWHPSDQQSNHIMTLAIKTHQLNMTPTEFIVQCWCPSPTSRTCLMNLLRPILAGWQVTEHEHFIKLRDGHYVLPCSCKGKWPCLLEQVFEVSKGVLCCYLTSEHKLNDHECILKVEIPHAPRVIRKEIQLSCNCPLAFNPSCFWRIISSLCENKQ